MVETSACVQQAGSFREQGCESRQGPDWRMEQGEATEQTYATDVESPLLIENNLKWYAFIFSVLYVIVKVCNMLYGPVALFFQQHGFIQASGRHLGDEFTRPFE